MTWSGYKALRELCQYLRQVARAFFNGVSRRSCPEVGLNQEEDRLPTSGDLRCADSTVITKYLLSFKLPPQVNRRVICLVECMPVNIVIRTSYVFREI
jgi:hypothetical protein